MKELAPQQHCGQYGYAYNRAHREVHKIVEKIQNKHLYEEYQSENGTDEGCKMEVFLHRIHLRLSHVFFLDREE